MPKNTAGAMNMTETRTVQARHFLVDENPVIEDFIAVKCDASELMRSISSKKNYGGGANPTSEKKAYSNLVLV
jgi:hypothetical protein